MDANNLKRLYGEEYPNAIIVNGERTPLSGESRFSRNYHSTKHKRGTTVSRLMDGSASITLSQLQSEWPTWTEGDRTDFCQNCDWLRGQTDFPDMLRFIMRHGDSCDCCGIASSIAVSLPSEEAFDFLRRTLQITQIGQGSNIVQAIALTKHRSAEATLRNRLDSIWTHKSLWADDKFINWVAFDATTGIAHLIELGASPSDFDQLVRQLSEHVCSGNRGACRNFLSKYYQWLQ